MSFKPTHPDASFSRPPSLPLSLDDTDMASIHATEISQALGQAAPPGSSLPLAEQKAWFLALCRAESVGFGDEAAHERAFTEFQLRLRGFEPLAALPAVSGLADLPASEVFEAHARAGALAEGLTERPPRPKRPAAARSAVFCMPKPEAGGLQAGASRGFSWEAPEPEASRLAHEAEATAKARALLKAAPKTDALAGPVAGLGESIGPGGQIEQEIPAALFDSAPAFLWGEHLERMSARPADEALATEALERGAAWVADRVSSKDIDPAELAAQFRRRASRLDAFVQAREWALAPAAPAQTESMGAESMDSAARRTLAGVPVAVKSLFWVQGEIASAGSKMLSRFRAPEDAGVVAALRAAGADFSCIVKTDEFAMGSRGASCAWGAARHPSVQGASPGGSSSGSAVGRRAPSERPRREPGRQLVRVRRGRGVRHGPFGPGLRHRRQRAPSGQLLRTVGLEAHARRALPARHDRLRLFFGHARFARALGEGFVLGVRSDEPWGSIWGGFGLPRLRPDRLARSR